MLNSLPVLLTGDALQAMLAKFEEKDDRLQAEEA